MIAEFHGGGHTRHIAEDNWEDLILGGGYEAVIFDCDGTLVESGKAHFAAFRDAVRAQGAELDQGWYKQRTGLDRVSLLGEFSSHITQPFDVARAAEQSIAAFEDHLHLVHRIGATSRLLERLSPSLGIAVGTNAETPVAKASLRQAGLLDRIEHIVSISDGLPPKPAPDIFRVAAEKLRTPAGSTLVIEDSPQGMLSAERAGMHVLLLAAEDETGAD